MGTSQFKMIYLGVTLALLGSVLGEGILSLPGPNNKDNYLKFDDPFENDLSELTMCVWLQHAYGDGGRYFFSYAHADTHTNELIFGDSTGGMGIWRGSKKWVSDVKPKENVWSHVCWTWVGETGDATLQVDGELVGETSIAPGSVVKAGGLLIIGQEQDSVGGGFDARQSWLGRMYDMHIWDRALNETELGFVYQTGFCGFGAASLGPLLSWSVILDNELQGAAQILVSSCDDSAEVASYGKVLRFPSQSDASTSNFLQFVPALAEEFTEFAVCTWLFKTYSDHGRYFFSYANREEGQNSIILGENSGGLGLWLNSKKLSSGVDLEQNTWYHLCFSWGSDAGAQIYLDGEMIAEDADLAAGTTKYGDGSLNIGQEQDSVGGGYDRGQAFSGSLYNLNIYSESLTADQVSELYANATFCHKSGSTGGPAKYVSWSELYDVIPDGDVVFEHGEAAWRHGAPNCGTDEKDVEAHNPACWEMEEKIRYDVDDNMGSIIGDVDAAKAACYATNMCQGITCKDLDDPEKLNCGLKLDISNPKIDKSRTSFKYNC